jgi:hypothetical protein
LGFGSGWCTVCSVALRTRWPLLAVMVSVTPPPLATPVGGPPGDFVLLLQEHRAGHLPLPVQLLQWLLWHHAVRVVCDGGVELFPGPAHHRHRHLRHRCGWRCAIRGLRCGVAALPPPPSPAPAPAPATPLPCNPLLSTIPGVPPINPLCPASVPAFAVGRCLLMRPCGTPRCTSGASGTWTSTCAPLPCGSAMRSCMPSSCSSCHSTCWTR